VRLSDLAANVAGAVLKSGGERKIARIVYDSGSAGVGDLFVAIPGLKHDGHTFASSAAGQGAAVAVERPVPLPEGTAWLLLPDTQLALAELAASLWGRPAHRLAMIGVTGSSGKSTTTHMIAHTLEACGWPAGFISTVMTRARGESLFNDSGKTTMAAPELQAKLWEIAEGGARAAVIESSSHALDQARVGACEFDLAAFTNVAHDHLDYHGSREDYLRAKARLIEICAAAPDKGIPKTAVLNHDDGSTHELLAYPIARRLTYGIKGEADVRAQDPIQLDGGRVSFRLRVGEEAAVVELQLPGQFNVYNALCAATCCLALDLDVRDVAAGLSSFRGLPGRLEPVELGQPFRVFVDFTDTAYKLSIVLPQLRAAFGGRLLVVIGTTGRSDHDRPAMGRALAQYSDFFVITTDDPVKEDPADLARQVELGVGAKKQGHDYEVVLDRRSAIRRALEKAQPGDTVLLAGKGHERTMILADGPVPWDERVEAETALRELAK
jgi:UDP-N-acetylmuramoyl-L-alanyl-D-glutamate--2,6-diaminopimelate ligase